MKKLRERRRRNAARKILPIYFIVPQDGLLFYAFNGFGLDINILRLEFYRCLSLCALASTWLESLGQTKNNPWKIQTKACRLKLKEVPHLKVDFFRIEVLVAQAKLTREQRGYIVLFEIIYSLPSNQIQGHLHSRRHSHTVLHHGSQELLLPPLVDLSLRSGLLPLLLLLLLLDLPLRHPDRVVAVRVLQGLGAVGGDAGGAGVHGRGSVALGFFLVGVGLAACGRDNKALR